MQWKPYLFGGGGRPLNTPMSSGISAVYMYFTKKGKFWTKFS